MLARKRLLARRGLLGELLGLAQAVLGVLELGDVGGDADRADRAAGSSPGRRAGQNRTGTGGRRRAVAALDGLVLRRRWSPGCSPKSGRTVVKGWPSRSRGVAEQVEGRLVDGLDGAALVEHDQRLGHRGEDVVGVVAGGGGLAQELGGLGLAVAGALAGVLQVAHGEVEEEAGAEAGGSSARGRRGSGVSGWSGVGRAPVSSSSRKAVEGEDAEGEEGDDEDAPREQEGRDDDDEHEAAEAGAVDAAVGEGGQDDEGPDRTAACRSAGQLDVAAVEGAEQDDAGDQQGRRVDVCGGAGAVEDEQCGRGRRRADDRPGDQDRVQQAPDPLALLVGEGRAGPQSL
jgi:hypothetical protein